MKPATEDKIVSWGCWPMLVAFCACVYLASTSHWGYAVGAVILAMGWTQIIGFHLRRDQRRNRAACDAAFAAAGGPLPVFETGVSYGFPFFTLTFVSEAEMARAKELGGIPAFKNYLQARYAHVRRGRGQFNADLAVWVTYMGWQERLAEPSPGRPALKAAPITSFGATLFSASPFIRSSLTPFLLAFAIFMPFTVKDSELPAGVLLATLEVVVVLLLLGFWAPRRMAHGAFRLTALFVFLAYAAWLFTELWSGEPGPVPAGVADYSLPKALPGLLLIGLPALWYAIYGRFVVRDDNSA